MLKAKTALATISSRLMKPSRRSSSLPESLPPSPTLVMSLLSVLKTSDKELSTNSDNTLDALLVPQPDGSLVLLPTKSPRNSKNPES